MTGYPHCCNFECCVTPKELAADVEIGSLPSMSNMLIDLIGGCTASSDGTYGITEQSAGAFEHPTGTVEDLPNYTVTLLLDGQLTRQSYQPIWSVTERDSYGYTINCWSYYYLTEYFNFDLIEVDWSGSFNLISSSNTMWPFWVKLEYWLYEDGVGDCILRVGARFLTRSPSYPGFSPTIQYFRGPFGLGGGSVNYAEEIHKYSDYYPCGEDDGVLPLPADHTAGGLPLVGQEEYGIWLSGNRYTLQDTIWDTYSGTDEPEYIENPQGRVGVSDIGLLWEINLTGDSITDLALLPNTTLNYANSIGTYSTDIKQTPGTLPASSTPLLSHYTPSSITIASGSFIRKRTLDTVIIPAYTVENSGTGSHVCQITANELTCNGDPLPTKSILTDEMIWELLYNGIDIGTTDYTYGDISITLKQPPP